MVVVGAAPRQSPPAIRVRPVPAVDPPFDDEIAPHAWAAAFGAAPLSTDRSAAQRRGWPAWAAVVPGQPGSESGPDDIGRPFADTWQPRAGGDPTDRTATAAGRGGGGPGRPDGARPDPPGGAGPGGGTEPGGGGGGPTGTGPGSTVAGASTEARNAVRRFLGVCLEILNGYRPAGQLRPLAGPAEAAVVIEQVSAAVARVTELRRAAGRPARTAPTAANPVRVRRLRVCEPRPGAAEATAVLLTAGRTWALAFRLERRDGTWAATVARLI
ncbi:MAG TPA: Rv3235 family protein [Catenuloplanes sp.]|jgi:hypothetical protein